MTHLMQMLIHSGKKTSADYFSGVVLGLFEDAQEDEINLNSVSLMTTVGEEKFGC